MEFVPEAQPINFSRDVTVTATPQKTNQAGNSREAEASTSSGSILRLHGVHNGHQIDEEHLSVDPPVSATSDATEWVVKIDNGDDAPLALQSVRLQMVERTLCFDATPEASYAVYYGDSALAAPRYDYATLFTPEVDAARAALGPEMNNPDYRPRPDERPFTEKHPGLLWTTLVLVVVLLGGCRVALGKAGFRSNRPCFGRSYRRVVSISLSQSGGLRISRGLVPSAGPTMPSRSIKSIRCAARP